MIYIEKNPIKIEAYKFIGEVTDELRSIGFLEPNPFQVNKICPQCGKTLYNHALIGIGNEFKIICPNSYIIIGKNGIQIMSSENFEAIYKPQYNNIEDAVFKEICDTKYNV